jgi:hypothetical protein
VTCDSSRSTVVNIGDVIASGIERKQRARARKTDQESPITANARESDRITNNDGLKSWQIR